MYSLESSSTIWLSDTPNVMSNTWDSDYFRIFTFVILKSKNLNKSFIIGNTHLDYKSTETQVKSIQLIYDTIKQYDLPAFIMGDFNCSPESDAIITANNYFVDAGYGFQDADKGTVNYFKNEYPNIKVDYIFQTFDSFQIIDYKVIEKKYNNHQISDHFPLYVEFI